MKSLQKIFLSLLPIVGSFMLMSSTTAKYNVGKAAWTAPATADATKNPVKGDLKATADGKKLYGMYCVVCHGEKGKGDGPAGMGLNPRPADHTSAKVQSQSDGAIFWKMTTGRPPMAGYDKILTVQQRWELVNYIRTFNKGEKTAKK
jgi:mono/diheme cytochrome c family protein